MEITRPYIFNCIHYSTQKRYTKLNKLPWKSVFVHKHVLVMSRLKEQERKWKQKAQKALAVSTPKAKAK